MQQVKVLKCHICNYNNMIKRVPRQIIIAIIKEWNDTAVKCQLNFTEVQLAG